MINIWLFKNIFYHTVFLLLALKKQYVGVGLNRTQYFLPCCEGPRSQEQGTQAVC